MALGHAQPFAQLLHAVKARVVCADVLNGGLHQRRQGGRGTVGIGQLTQQCVGQLAAGTAVGGLFLSKAVHQFGSGRAGTALGKEGQFVQPSQKLGSRLPGKLDAEQMADAFRHKGQRGTAQDQVPGRHGLRRQNERCTQRQRPGSRYGCRALAAGHKAHPQSFAGEGEGGRQLQILHGSGKSDGVPVKKQYLTPLINKMLFYITKLSVIIVPTNEHAVKSVRTLKIMEANDYGFDQLPAHL